jgi:acyl-CoA reductase-like NAD-dependent aldehyde dehydrogenase
VQIDIVARDVAESGKPVTTMRQGELPFAIDNLRFFAAAARSLEGTGAGVLSTGYTSLLVRRPIGVVAAITPWNFPFLMAVWKAGAALAAGNGVVLKPASDGAGAFYPPTLLVRAAQDSEIVQGEVFGPVLVALPFVTEDEAVVLANDTPYGLASSVWTPDLARALRVSHRLKAGVTWVNDHLPIASEVPHGGRKGSGFGKDMGQEAVLEHTVSHHLMLRHAAPPEREGFRPA